MKKYTLENLDELGVHHIGAETCGLGLRSHYGLTQEAWEHWCHFTGLVQLLDNPRAFLTRRYYSTLVVPRTWMKEFLVYLVLQAGSPRVLVVEREEHEGYYSEWRVYAQEGESDPDFLKLLDIANKNNWSARFVVPDETAEQKHGFRNRHYFSGEIE